MEDTDVRTMLNNSIGGSGTEICWSKEDTVTS